MNETSNELQTKPRTLACLVFTNRERVLFRFAYKSFNPFGKFQPRVYRFGTRNVFPSWFPVKTVTASVGVSFVGRGGSNGERNGK